MCRYADMPMCRCADMPIVFGVSSSHQSGVGKDENRTLNFPSLLARSSSLRADPDFTPVSDLPTPI